MRTLVLVVIIALPMMYTGVPIATAACRTEIRYSEPKTETSQEGDLPVKGTAYKVRVCDGQSSDRPNKTSSTGEKSSGKSRGVDVIEQRKAEQKAAMAKYKAEVARRTAVFERERALWIGCLEKSVGCLSGMPQLNLPDQPEFKDLEMTEAEYVRATVSPQTIAYTAMAELTLSPPQPKVGPDPSINRWKMAAVGYPLWLWVDGDTNPATASTTAYGMTVTLNPHMDKVVFSMGDGTSVTCASSGTPWTRGVGAGKKSPNCGHVYQKASLPQGKYAVTATTYWTINWNVAGATGALPLRQQATTEVPVGELQVLVR